MLKFFVFASILTYVYATVQQGVVVLNNGDINGKVTFTKTSDGVKIEGTINGLPAGKHGFHIHASGDLSDGCKSAGGHLNPTKKDHGAPSDENRHVGDLGNIVADESKVAKIDFVDKVIALDGENCIIGRALVIHADEDDLGKGVESDSKTTGHAGARIACGVVGILNETSASTGKMATGSTLLLLITFFIKYT